MSDSRASTVPEFLHARRRADEVPGVQVRSGRAGHLTVACILDEFSFESFAPEAEFVQLTMDDWLVELSATQPDLLLVESAWRGFRGSWWNTVPRCGPEMKAILEWCRERAVPTAFWNKEDPVHFGTFLNVASLFDVVFTTDVDCVPRYKAKLGHDRVHFLPFAAQPLIHNPLERFERIDGCAFAGAYYARYPERNRAFEAISDAMSERGPLDIYDRNHGGDHPDYAFPERFRERIVGRLEPADIDAAYKGYTSNINLNSVHASQSMFARRVYELLASNTTVVSNFARGMRRMFGDLVHSSNSAAQLVRALDAVDALPNGPERLRAQGMRKVFAEHTYSARLEFIAEQCGIVMPDAPRETVAIIAAVADARQVTETLALAVSQRWPDWHLILHGPGSVTEVGDARVHHTRSLDGAIERARDVGATFVARWNARDWYGPHYLADLVSALRWANTSAAGHQERWVAVDGVLERCQEGSAWTTQPLVLHRALVRIEAFDSTQEEIEGLAVAPIEHCEAGRGLNASALEPASSLQLDEGLSLAAMRAYADALWYDRDEGVDDVVPFEQLLRGIRSGKGVHLAQSADGSFQISAALAMGTHQYLFSTATTSLDVVPEERVGHFAAGPGLEVILVVRYLDDQGETLGHTMLPNGRNVTFEVPEGAVAARIGLRVSGAGSCVLEMYAKSAQHPSTRPLLLTANNLLVTNIYPAYEDLYRNGFVASRVRAYRNAGFDTEIFVADPRQRVPAFREFEGTDVAVASTRALAASLTNGPVDNVLVHFLDRGMAAALRSAKRLSTVTVWVHGFEIQPWHRRAFQFTTDHERTAAQKASALRMEMWRELFEQPPEGWHFVFVSRFLAEQAFEDVGIRLPDDRYSLVHNPVDTTMFRYREKQADERFRVLSVRPYASSIYANDQAVAAVLHLRETRDDFDRFSFAFYGSGPLFDEVTRPLQELPNVELHRTFLEQREIAELHSHFGVFLTPSRMDTQGVSRGEAMASGLVPVASDIAAVPEFVDERSGILCPPEDPVALASAMGRLADDPELFRHLSRGAAERVATQLEASAIVAHELAIVNRA